MPDEKKLTATMMRRPSGSHRRTRRRYSRKLRSIAADSADIAKAIYDKLRSHDVEVSDAIYNRLVRYLTENGGRFEPKILEMADVPSLDFGVFQEVARVAIEKTNINESYGHVIRFDTEMERFFKRLERGKDTRFAFIRMRSDDSTIHHVHVRVRNHWELGRMIEDIESLDKDVLAGFNFHTCIDGLHMDCIPLRVTNGLPVKWFMSVAIPDCECKCANWERKPFVGGDWL